MPRSNRIVGITLVVIGVLILLGQMGVDFFGWLWPVLLCCIGGVLLWSWYTRGDDSGKVFSGVLLILLALFFLFMRREHVDMVHHWPFFVLAPGISLLVMSQIDRSRRDASVPGWITIAAAGALYFFTSGMFMGLMGFIFGLIGMVLRLLVPLALVALGGWMLLNFRRKEQRAATTPMPEKYEPAPVNEEEAEYTELDISVGPRPGVDVAEVEAAEPEADEPDADQPATAEPDTAEPEADEPNSAEPEADQPATAEPDTAEPEADEPDADEPDDPPRD
jgi:hypothetical protein